MRTILKENTLAAPFLSQVDFDPIFSVLVSENMKYGKRPFLLDNGLCYDHTAFPVRSELYTITDVCDEDPRNKYWTEIEKEDHILSTHSRSDFRDNDGVVQATGVGVYTGTSAEVFYNKEGTSATCPKGYLTTVTLTGDQGTVSVCSHLSATDFGLLVPMVALPFTLVTQEKCLGWCARYLNSCMQGSASKRLIGWNYNYKNVPRKS